MTAEWIVVLLVLLTTCLACNCQFDPKQNELIGFQPHSVNDFRAWPQLLRHQPQFLKIDANYQPHTFCSKLNPSYYPSSVVSDPRGCFVFVHDTPTPSNNHYNGTDDFWQMIVSNLDYFTRSDFRVYVAMCFKNGGQCDTGWSSLVDDFFDTAKQYIEKYELNMEFILDGSGVPVNKCLYKKWLPWNSTWIKKPVEALFSNSEEFAYDRFTILNAPFGTHNEMMRVLKHVYYGKFLRNGQYPFLIWEPSDQVEIMRAIGDFLDGPVNPIGLKFAINIDPVMFDLYSRNSWNFPIVPNAKQPHVVVLQSRMVLNFTTLVIYDQGTYGVWTSNRVNGPITQIASGKLLPISGSILSVSTLNDFVLVISSGMSIFKYDFGSQSLNPVYNSTLGRPTQAALVFESSYAMVYLTALSNPATHCLIQIQANIIKSNSASVLDTWCLVPEGAVTVVDTFSFSAAIHVESLSLQGALTYSSRSNVHACTFQANWSPGALSFSKFTFECSANAIAVGTNTSTSVLSTGTDVYVLQVQTNSYCDNSEEHNKNATISMCDTRPKSTSNIMTYTLSKWADLSSHISLSGGYITNCHKTMIHGMYDMGQNPSVALFKHNNVVAALEVHDGVLTKDFQDQSGCGKAITYEFPTIAMNSWTISNRL